MAKTAESGAALGWGEPLEDWALALRGMGRRPATIRYNVAQVGLLRRWYETEGIAFGAFRCRQLTKYLHDCVTVVLLVRR